jgi:Domain of unknown function (DUF4347)
MSVNLLVVGQHPETSPRFDPDFDLVARMARCTETFKVARCCSPDALAQTVRSVASASHTPVDTLDLFDHGGGGFLWMGEQKLFIQDGTGLSIARALRPLLTIDARVRLLGCETAVGAAGRALLTMLREALGGSVVVYGTVTTTDSTNFDHTGFRKIDEERILFSSTEAATATAPSALARGIEWDSWYASNAPVPQGVTQRIPMAKSR